MSCAFQLINYTLPLEENVSNVKSVHVAITFQILEMSSITPPNQTILNIHTRVVFFFKNISDFTDLQNEKNQFGSFQYTELFWLLKLV